ncbi:hypothetical protein G9A89_014125 [Geosiphon pyriformis]|nr:hypothetical protein G9A89_014125 [Geosiphon pyriformis]
MDGLLRNLGMIGYNARAAAFFEDINLGLDVSVQDLVSSTLVELQTIALALEYIPAVYSVYLFSNSQTALNACRSKFDLIKGHFGILGNNCANSIAGTVFLSGWYLPSHISEHFLLVDGGIVSGNSRHFICDVFCAVCCVHWEVSSGSGFLDSGLHSEVNWPSSSRVWHPDLHMATGFTSRHTADTQTYFIKALHHQFPMAVRKCIYDKCYPSVLCLYCCEVEVSDYLLSTCASDFLVFSALYKSLVFNRWLQEAVSIFYNPKVAGVEITDFVCSLCLTFKNNIWLIYVKHCAFMEKNGLISADNLIPVLVSDLVLGFSTGVIKLLGITEFFERSFFNIQYDKTKLFFDFETTVGPSIVIIKKVVKNSGFGNGFKPVLSRKKRKSVALKEDVGSKGVPTEMPSGHSWGSETGNTTESESINIKEECLVKETSFDYDERGILINEDYEHTPKEPSVKTTKALGKLLGKINFSGHDNNNDVFLDTPLELSFSLKNLVSVSVRKSFALDIGLDKVVGKSSQEKLMVIRKLFSKVNGFGGVSTPSKFSGIIYASFISKSSLVQAIEKMKTADILVNNNLKKLAGCSDRAVVIKKIPVGTSAKAVCTVLSKFGIIKLIKMQLVKLWQKTLVKFEQSNHTDLVTAEDYHRALLYTLPMRTNTHNIWDFIRCTVVCFDSVESLNATMGTTLVFKSTNLHWSSFVSARYAKCEKSGHTSLGCAKSGKIFYGSSFCKVLLDADKSRLAIAIGSVNVGSSSEMKLFLPIVTKINDRFATFKHSLVSLAEHVDILAKGLESSESMVFQLSSGWADIVMSKDLSVATGSRTVVGVVVFDASVIGKMEDILKNLAITVMGLLAKMDNTGLVRVVFFLNNRASVEICYIFFGTEVMIILNNFFTCYVVKIEKVSGHFISVQLLFKDKLLVTILGLYAGAFAEAKFGQFSVINFFIVKTVNSSIFVVLGEDFNKDGSRKSASFKFCLGLGLVNAFNEHSLVNASTWGNLKGAMKVIDYIFVSRCLLLAVAGHKIISVLDFFDTNHNAVIMSIRLGGLLDIQDCWKFKIKDTDDAKWLHYKDCSSARLLGAKNRFSTAAANNNLDSIWSVLERVIVESADEIFFKHWFSKFWCLKNKQPSKFLGLELLVAKIVKKLSSADILGFNNFVKRWLTLDVDKALIVTCMVQAGEKQMNIFKHLSLVKREYRKSKMYESKLAKEMLIRNAIKKCIEKFCLDKDGLIRSVLDHSFCKIVLDHLVVDNELVLKPKKVKSDYTPLGYVRDNTFSSIMCTIDMSELALVIGSLPDGKAHSGEEVLKCLLVLLNTCLTVGEPYNWNGVLTNTQPIVLIETARKILFKILSDYNNFLVLKSTSTQFPVFAIGLIIKDAFEKNREIWLVHLQYIKMYSRFIDFFGNIYKNRLNKIMIDFGLSDGYRVHDKLDQGKIDTKFVSRTNRIKNGGSKMSYFAAGVFVDNTIWVGNCQASIQYALDIVSVRAASLSICGQPISIAKKGETHCYLGMFLSTEGLFKPSIAKAYSDVHFFTNVLLRKAVMNKQFLYLVLAVLQPIDIMIRKNLKFKACLLCNFPSEALHHPFLYGLKSFEQVQTESKLAAVISFSNDHGILGHLFYHQLCVSPVNNFLAGVIKIFLDNELSLANKLPNAFHDLGVFSMFLVLGESLFFDSVSSLKHFGVAFNPRDFVSYWFVLISRFLNNKSSFKSVLVGSFLLLPSLCISNSKGFVDIRDGLHKVWSGNFEVYTNGLLKNTGSAEIMCRAAAYFPALDMSISIGVWGLLSSTMAELHAVALALECVLFLCRVDVYLNSQAAIDACVSEIVLVFLNFCDHCWIERRHIYNLVQYKDLTVYWIKVKSHSGVASNVKANTLAGEAADSPVFLPMSVQKQFLMVEGLAVSGNTHHFVWDVFRSVSRAHWKAGPDHNVISRVSVSNVDWVTTSRVWHSDSYILVGFTSQRLATLHMYMMKAVHYRLPIAVCKRLYDKKYPGVLCLLCGEVELLDHVFTCAQNADIQKEILSKASAFWASLVGVYCLSSFAISQVLDLCHLDVGLYSVICKDFMLKDWCKKTIEVFNEKKKAVNLVVNLVGRLVELYYSKVWLLRSEFKVCIKKAGLVGNNSELFLGVLESFAVSFGYRRPCFFFSGLDGSLCVNIGV